MVSTTIIDCVLLRENMFVYVPTLLHMQVALSTFLYASITVKNKLKINISKSAPRSYYKKETFMGKVSCKFLTFNIYVTLPCVVDLCMSVSVSAKKVEGTLRMPQACELLLICK